MGDRSLRVGSKHFGYKYLGLGQGVRGLAAVLGDSEWVV